MSQAWQYITTNFHNLMEDSSTGVASLTAITNEFHEADDAIDFRTTCIPSSVTNGAYSTILQRVNSIHPDLGTGILDFDFNVLLLVCFEFNVSDYKKRDYNAAMQDVEEIIKRRLNTNTYEGSMITTVDLVLWNQIKWLSQPDEEKFGCTEIVFRVSGRTSLE